MKRFFTIVAAALMTSAFTASAFAGWGPNGMFGNADPNARPVGQSSRPSTNPASAPILNPPDPTKNLGAVPGGYKDSSLGLNKAQQAARIAKARAAFDIKNNSPKLAPTKTFRPLTPPMNSTSGAPNTNSGYGNGSMKPSYPNGIPFMPTSNHQSSGYGGNSNSGYGNDSMKPSYPNGIPYLPTSNHQSSGYGGNSRPGSGFFGNDVSSRPTNYPQMPPAGRPTNYPPAQPHNNYPAGNVGHAGSQFPSNNSWGGYGGNAQTSGYGGQSSNSSWSGYGGASSNSGYGMFAR